MIVDEIQSNIQSVLGTANEKAALESFVRRRLRVAGIEWRPGCTDEYLARVAKEFSILNITRTTSRIEGSLVPRGSEKQFDAYISTLYSVTRQRFSLAHEIGHAIIFELCPQFRSISHRSLYSQVGSRYEERLCDFLAGIILLPDNVVRDYIASSDSNPLAAAKALAMIRGVSLSSVVRRMQELGHLGLGLLRVIAQSPDTTSPVLSAEVIVNRPTNGFRSRYGLAFKPANLTDKIGRAAISDLNQRIETSYYSSRELCGTSHIVLIIGNYATHESRM